MPTSPSSSNGDDQTETDESIQSILTGRFEEGQERQQGVQADEEQEKKQQVGGLPRRNFHSVTTKVTTHHVPDSANCLVRLGLSNFN